MLGPGPGPGPVLAPLAGEDAKQLVGTGVEELGVVGVVAGLGTVVVVDTAERFVVVIGTAAAVAAASGRVALVAFSWFSFRC